jgi:hypothetical protein
MLKIGFADHSGDTEFAVGAGVTGDQTVGWILCLGHP